MPFVENKGKKKMLMNCGRVFLFTPLVHLHKFRHVHLGQSKQSLLSNQNDVENRQNNAHKHHQTSQQPRRPTRRLNQQPKTVHPSFVPRRRSWQRRGKRKKKRSCYEKNPKATIHNTKKKDQRTRAPTKETQTENKNLFSFQLFGELGFPFS